LTKKSINTNNIFEVFHEGVKTYNSVFASFEESPYIKIKIFTKLIQNNENFQQNVRKYMDKYKIEYNDIELTNSAYTINFNRAFDYISQINPQNEIDRGALESCYDLTLLKCINETLKFFEDREEYEKCAIILPIKDYLKSLAPPKSFL
jgi:hypothetical protein